VKNVSGPQNTDDANENPKRVQCDVGVVAFDHGTSCQQDGVGRVEYPDEHERTFRPKPTDKAEAEDAHQYADHFDGFKVTDNE
jgi:hypothetical protein